MKNTILLIMLIASAMAAITISPTTPVKVGDDITWVESISVNVTRYSVFSNTTNQTTCYSVEPTLSEMLCSEMDNKDAMAHLDVEDTHISEPIICQKTYSNETLLQGVNITESNPNTNTTVVHQTYTCAHTFEHTISNAHPDASVPYSTYLSSSPENESTSGDITIQSINITVDPIPTDVDNSFRVSGKFLWSDGTPLVNKPVDISSDLCNELHSTTDSKGGYSAVCDYDAYVVSSSYKVDVTAHYTLDSSVNTTTYVDTKGLSDVDFSLTTKSIIGSSGSGASFPFVWKVVKGTPITHVAITAKLTSTEQSFSKECPGEQGTTTSKCEDSFLVVAPDEWGNYSFVVYAVWDDARGTHHNESVVGLLVIPKESTFTLDKANILKDIPVGKHIMLNANISSTGNTNTTVSIKNSGEMWVEGNDGKPINKISLPKDGSLALKIKAYLPYATQGVKKGSIIFTNDLGLKRSLEYTLTPRYPHLKWKQNSITTNVTTSNITINNILQDTGEPAQGVHISAVCPSQWECVIHNPSITEISSVSDVNVTVDMQIVYENGEHNKTIEIMAKDAAGRSTVFPVVLQFNPENTKTIGQEVVTSTITDADFSNGYLYFVSDGKLIKKDTVDTSKISPRTERESSLSSWTVSAMDDSDGLGSVCDVYVVTSNKSYLIDPDPAVITTLLGNVGDVAYEYIVPHSVGECKAHLAYQGADTMTYVSIVGKEPEQTSPMTSAEIQNIIDESARKSTLPLSTAISYLAFILAGIAVIYAYYVLAFKRKGVELPKHKSKSVFVIGNIRGLTERGREAHGTITQKIDNLFKTKKQKEEELEGKPFGKFFLKLNEISEGDSKWD